MNQMPFKVKGMQRDLAESSFNPQYAYEIKNMRIMATNDNTLMSLVNEKGPKQLPITWHDGDVEQTTNSFSGTPIGQAVINDTYVLFTTASSSPRDRIYKFWFKKNLDNVDVLHGKTLALGDFGFDVKHPIETLVSYENEAIQKVYWVDGVKQPRFINIAASGEVISSSGQNSFNFTVNLKLTESIEVEKTVIGNGLFPSGVIQYAFTYFNKFGQESNIFNTTDIQYLAYYDRGATPEENVGNSFKITITNPDSSFDYVRVYSIYRTSINSTPVVKRLSDIKITGPSITCIDNGAYGDIIDPRLLLYIGGEQIIASTINQKDNTLFLGDIKIERKIISPEIKEDIRSNGSQNLAYLPKSIESIVNPTGVYPYSNGLKSSLSKITTFKQRETYRFGLVFQHKSGKWSEVVFLKDLENSQEIGLGTRKGVYSNLNLVAAKTALNDSSLLAALAQEGYVRAMGVVVYPTISDRSILCQGILNPTVYNVKDRAENSPFAQSSWFSRPMMGIDPPDDEGDWPINAVDPEKGSYIEFRHNRQIPPSNKINAEIQNIHYEISPYISHTDYALPRSKWIEDNKHLYYVDQSIVTLHSPDIEFDDQLKFVDLNNTKLRIIGAVPITATSTDMSISTSTAPMNPGAFKKPAIGTQNLDPSGSRGLAASKSWHDKLFTSASGTDDSIYQFVVYPWHKTGALNNANSSNVLPSVLNKKKMSNTRFSAFTKYEATTWDAPGISTPSIFDSEDMSLIKLKTPAALTGYSEVTYYGNVDSTSFSNGLYPIIINDPTVGLTQLTDAYNAGSTDPISIKYKSSPHIVLALGNAENTTTQPVLPATNHGESNMANKNVGGSVPFWKEASKNFQVSQQNVSFSLDYGSFYMGELYRDNVPNRFGGETAEALINNNWLPAGPPVSLKGPTVTIYYTRGDTYFQRYDHLKTYPFTMEDENSVVDIVSFMVETKINIDGRSDKNRNSANSLIMNPKIFNIINPIYNQKDNFFSYKPLNTELFTEDWFPNSITWTLPKSSASLTDPWTQITLSSILDLDGNKGKINSIKRLNNDLIVFQDEGVSNILFNSRTQIASSDGVPIEIANSGRVEGKRYLSDTIGCQNKWSIVESQAGLYFIDDINKSIMLFDGKFNNISDDLGFHSWINDRSKEVGAWNPSDFTHAVGYYDKRNSEVLFISKDECLAFSEPLKTFSSFYSYNNTPFFMAIKDKGIWVNKSRSLGGGTTTDYMLWEHNKGEYNRFFDKSEDFHVTVIANAEPLKDKIFDILEFRSDSFDQTGAYQPSDTFNKLETWNEYQSGLQLLSNNKNRPSPLKKKFRMWRVNIPRDRSDGRSRMRNPWLFLKLSKQGSLCHHKTILHDLNVYYTI